MTTADLTTALTRACLNRPRPRLDANIPAARIAKAFTTTTALAARLNGVTR